MPHGILTYLPFAVLRNRARGTILAEELALSYLPAAAALPIAPRETGARSGEREGGGIRSVPGSAPFDGG